MPSFLRISAGKVSYDTDVVPATYLEVECGGGGDCLFLSLSWLLTRNNINYTALQLRTSASATLVDWANNGVPAYVNNFAIPMPNLVTAQGLANPGVWGDLACVMAVVHKLHEDDFEYVRVHVLGPTADHVSILDTEADLLIDENPVWIDIHVIYRTYTHYRALVLENTAGNILASKLVANYKDLYDPPKLTKKVSASLNHKRGTSEMKGEATTTIDIVPEGLLEIHHINAGQADCTLIFVKDKSGTIQKSMLIDTGVDAGPIITYLDGLIKNGNFRPIDILSISHWDMDHVRGAPALLRHKNAYFSVPIQIFDLGDDSPKDTDYENFKTAIDELGLAGFRSMPFPGDVLLSCLGVRITCIGVHDYGLYPYVNELPEKKRESFKLTHLAEPIPPQKLEKSDSVTGITLAGGTKNNASIAMVLTFGKFTYFTAGDMEHHSEVTVASYIRLAMGRHVCAWKMSHHGSHMSTTSEFMYYAAPRFGVASCGQGNMFGHPGIGIEPRFLELNKTVGQCCSYYVTGVVNQGLFAQPDNVYMFSGQGHIVITVTDVQANSDDHDFTVEATGSQAKKLFKCGDREDVYPQVQNYTELVRKRDPVQRRKSVGRKERRKHMLSKVVNQWLYGEVGLIARIDGKDYEAIDKWLKSKGIYGDFSTLIQRLERVYSMSSYEDNYGEQDLKDDREPKFEKDMQAFQFLRYCKEVA